MRAIHSRCQHGPLQWAGEIAWKKRLLKEIWMMGKNTREGKAGWEGMRGSDLESTRHVWSLRSSRGFLWGSSRVSLGGYFGKTLPLRSSELRSFLREFQNQHLRMSGHNVFILTYYLLCGRDSSNGFINTDSGQPFVVDTRKPKHKVIIETCLWPHS